VRSGADDEFRAATTYYPHTLPTDETIGKDGGGGGGGGRQETFCAPFTYSASLTDFETIKKSIFVMSYRNSRTVGLILIAFCVGGCSTNL